MTTSVSCSTRLSPVVYIALKRFFATKHMTMSVALVNALEMYLASLGEEELAACVADSGGVPYGRKTPVSWQI